VDLSFCQTFDLGVVCSVDEHHMNKSRPHQEGNDG